MMWRETPYVVIGAHEPGKENKELICGTCGIRALDHCYEAVVLERDPETGEPTGLHMRIVFCNPDVMRKFGETIVKGAELWEAENDLKSAFEGGFNQSENVERIRREEQHKRADEIKRAMNIGFHLKCLRCGAAYYHTEFAMSEMSYRMYSYCPDCIDKGIKALKERDKQE